MQPIFYQYDFVSLSPAQRLELAQELIASVRSEALADDFSSDEIAAMENEMVAIRRGEIKPISWDQLCKQLNAS